MPEDEAYIRLEWYRAATGGSFTEVKGVRVSDPSFVDSFSFSVHIFLGINLSSVLQQQKSCFLFLQYQNALVYSYLTDTIMHVFHMRPKTKLL